MTAPYYQDDSVLLYHGDCLDIGAWLAADVLITDPPYGSDSENFGYGRRQNNGDGKQREGAQIASDGSTVIRDAALAKWAGRPALVFGSPRLPEPPGTWADRLVWDKKRPGMNGGPWRYRHESIYVTEGFVRQDNETTSILTAFPDQQHHIHQKPLGLMTSLINCAPPGVIADPFAGSGSTLVAARNLGRKAIGVEIEERYCELVARRLDQMALDFGAPA